MKCENAEVMISLHVDNKLSLEEVTSLMEHLNSCKKCRENYEDFKDIKIVLSDLKIPETSSAFTDSLMKRITDSKKSSGIVFANSLKKHFIMAASFIFIVAASVIFLPSKTQDTGALAEYYLNYDQNASIEEIYDEDIVSFLLLY